MGGRWSATRCMGWAAPSKPQTGLVASLQIQQQDSALYPVILLCEIAKADQIVMRCQLLFLLVPSVVPSVARSMASCRWWAAPQGDGPPEEFSPLPGRPSTHFPPANRESSRSCNNLPIPTLTRNAILKYTWRTSMQPASIVSGHKLSRSYYDVQSS